MLPAAILAGQRNPLWCPHQVQPGHLMHRKDHPAKVPEEESPRRSSSQSPQCSQDRAPLRHALRVWLLKKGAGGGVSPFSLRE